MITPPYLKKGDKIAIASPSRKITLQEMDPAIRAFREWGLEVVAGSHMLSSYHQFAGTDDERSCDIQALVDNDSVKAVISSRGGYGASRIIDNIDFSRFRKYPKWMVGFSDFTVFHSHIQKHFGVETIHAMMPLNFPGVDGDKADKARPASSLNKTLSVSSLKKVLFGDPLMYEEPAGDLSRPGMAKGVLTGGNLSMLCSLSGTTSDIDTTGKILFIEDLDEYLYHIDRMMMNLKRSGKLDGLAGLIVGGLTGMHDNEVPFGKSAEEIVMDAVAEYDYPVCTGFPAGHQDKNLAMIFGRKASLSVGEMTRLEF
jgi:muramoyltetrapeptide carboxypeptidase